MSEDQLRRIALRVRNWGQRGPEDELGTFNYITPERIAAACRLATTGKVFALGIPLERNGPQSGTRRHYDLDPFPGVSVHTAPWLHARQIAAIASDNYAVEVRPSEIPGFRNPFHVVAIPNMGLPLGEIFFLEELAADCAADGRYAFLLVAPPLPVMRAVGTPINPYALK
jgi:hypothetical protein